MKKNIPRKPKIVKISNVKYYTKADKYYCPNCDKELIGVIKDTCDSCDQQINWKVNDRRIRDERN